MSAFVVNDETISGMLSAIGLKAYHGDSAAYYWNGNNKNIVPFDNTLGGEITVQEAGQKLLDENHRSVTFRYRDNSDALADFGPGRVFITRNVRYLKPIEIIRLCDCFNYQACETDNWQDTEAFAISQGLRERAIRALPGWDKAPWGL